MTISSERQIVLPRPDARCSVEISVHRDTSSIRALGQSTGYAAIAPTYAEIGMYVGNDGWTWTYRERITVEEANNFFRFFRTNQAMSETLTYGTFTGIWSLITSRPFPAPQNIQANVGRSRYEDSVIATPSIYIDSPEAEEESPRGILIPATRLDFGGLGI
jgi:hypothetical protein